MLGVFAVCLLCRLNLVCFVWFVPVRPKFQTYGVRHMLPYLYIIIIYVYLAYELHVYPVIYMLLSYILCLELLDYKI